MEERGGCQEEGKMVGSVEAECGMVREGGGEGEYGEMGRRRFINI
jgi:hypothetical protein